MKDQTPFEAWYRYKPSLKILKVFDCLCFTYIPQVKRDKLDKKATTSIFIGYSTGSQAYGVFQPETGRIIMNKDVYFVEDEQWSWEDSNRANQIPSKSRHLSTVNPLEEHVDEEWQNELTNDTPIRGTRLLYDIYQRCNVDVCEPAGYHDAKHDKHWMATMKEELSMIEKKKLRRWLIDHMIGK